MSSRKERKVAPHEWTPSEMHTLLCLMAKGVHREKRSKKNDDPGHAKRHAHLEVATALNNAVHKNDYESDIPKQEVSRMIDQLLEERKAIVGPGGYMDRATRGCITRGLKRMWDRPTKFDFDGSKGEWKRGRKEKEMAKHKAINRGTATYQAPKEGQTANDRFHYNTGQTFQRQESIRPAADHWNMPVANNAGTYSQAIWHGPSQETPYPNTNMGFPTVQGSNASNYGLEASNLGTNSAQTGPPLFPAYSNSFVQGSLYEQYYAYNTPSTTSATNASSSGLPRLLPPPQSSFQHQNIPMGFSLNPPVTAESFNSIENDKMLNQDKDGAMSTSPAVTEDKDGDVKMKN